MAGNDWDGYESVQTEIHRAELDSHMASDLPIRREDDGFVGLDTVKPDSPDDSMHFVHTVPGEMYTREPPKSVHRVRTLGSTSWISRTYVMSLVSLANTPNSAIRIAGKRKGRRHVTVALLVGTQIVVSADRIVQPATINNSGDFMFVTNTLPANLPTEGEVWASLPLDAGAGSFVFCVTEFYDE